MTTGEWVQFSLNVVMLVVTVLNVTVLVAFRTGKFSATQSTSLDTVQKDLLHVESTCRGRAERVHAEVRGLSAQVQEITGRVDRLPNDLRGQYVSRDLFEDHAKQTHREIERLWTNVRSDQ